MVARQSTATLVLVDWSLKPTGLAVGDQFRLLFLSSTKRNASSTDIADYNTFIQTRAAAGHTDIRSYSTGFRAVGCTSAVDARDNTSTTYTSTAKGVPIYWLNGAKAADEYEDFYDGSWDDEANDKNESGANGPDTSLPVNYPLTGCRLDGTEALTGSTSRALGTASSFGSRVSRPNSSASGHGPLHSSDSAVEIVATRPMYGLSAVFQVTAANPTPVTLVSNLSQTANQHATYSRDHGQAFTTGSNSTGYTVTSVTIVSTDPNADAIPLQICEVDGNVHPTTVCTDLTPPSSYPQGNLTYTAPTSPALTLDADTTYMLVFKAPPSPTELRVAATSSDAQDSTSLTGFSIANVFQWYNNSNTWVIANGGNAIRITITGRANTATGPEVTVSFPPYVYTVREGGTVSVPVNLSADPERTVIIPIMASGLHGATAEDYSVVPTSVTFNAGGIFSTITLSATDDGVNDSDGESVLLSFGTLPSRVTAGAIFSLTIPIIDNNRLNPNNPPTASNGTVTRREDWRYTFKATDFDYSDAENDAFDHLKITELPAQGRGVLTLNNVPITQNDLPMTIDSTRNRTGRLNYAPPADGNGTGFASFKFKVNDGRDDSTGVYTMTINVTPVNDPAYGRPYIRGVSQVGYTLTAKTFFAIGDRDGVPATFDYQWKRYAADGTSFEANIGTNSPMYTLTESDRGTKVSIEVSFTDNEGTREGPLESFNLPRLPTHTVGEANFHSNMGLLGDTSIDFTADHGLPFTTGNQPKRLHRLQGLDHLRGYTRGRHNRSDLRG